MENISPDDIVAIIVRKYRIMVQLNREKGGFGMDIMMRTSVDKESMI